jgi:tRNA pseudouridine55 synthase
MGQEKEYTGSIFLGATRPSYDKETAIDQYFPIEHIVESDIRKAASTLTGEIRQVPPVFSAIKKDGKKSYESARAGEDLHHEPRTVFIREFEITGITMPLVHFRIVCSKGTYIRSVAYDLWRILGSGAYLESLCRTRIGEFRLEDARSVQDFVNSLQE